MNDRAMFPAVGLSVGPRRSVSTLAVAVALLLGATSASAESACPDPARAEIRDVQVICLESSASPPLRANNPHADGASASSVVAVIAAVEEAPPESPAVSEDEEALIEAPGESDGFGLVGVEEPAASEREPEEFRAALASEDLPIVDSGDESDDHEPVAVAPVLIAHSSAAEPEQPTAAEPSDDDEITAAASSGDADYEPVLVTEVTVAEIEPTALPEGDEDEASSDADAAEADELEQGVELELAETLGESPEELQASEETSPETPVEAEVDAFEPAVVTDVAAEAIDPPALPETSRSETSSVLMTGAGDDFEPVVVTGVTTTVLASADRVETTEPASVPSIAVIGFDSESVLLAAPPLEESEPSGESPSNAQAAVTVETAVTDEDVTVEEETQAAFEPAVVTAVTAVRIQAPVSIEPRAMAGDAREPADLSLAYEQPLAVGNFEPAPADSVGRPLLDAAPFAIPDGRGTQLAMRFEPDQAMWFPDSIAQATAEDIPSDAYYQVGSFDSLSVVVWRNPELSTSVTVRPDGRISMPLVEDLYVEGMTPSQVADAIEARLGQFVQDPFVTVIVNGFSGTFAQQIRIVGGATPPQAIPYRSGMTILDVMVAVGGISPYGDGNAAMILRGVGTDRRQIPLRLDDLLDDGDSTANVNVHPGDIVIIPEGFFDGDWTFTQGASFNVTVSDNIDRAPPGDEEAAIITEVGPTWQLAVDTARIQAALTSSTQLRAQGLHDEGLSIRGSLGASSTIELIDDFMFIDASATSSRQTLDTTSSGADVNQSQVTSARISPSIRNRFGDFANSVLSVAFAQTFVDSAGVSDDGTLSGAWNLSSGSDFSKFSWSFNASGSRTLRSDAENQTEGQATFNPRYQVSRNFAVTGSLGFQIRDDGNAANDVSDPIWQVGFDWQPSRRTDVSLSYGQRDAEESVSASANYRITPRTSIGFSYSEEFETAQERLQSDLASIAIDPDTGELIDTRTGLPFNPNTNPFSIEDESRRSRRMNVQFSHSRQRDTFSATLTGEEQEISGSTDQRVIQIGGSWSRRINPRTTLSVNGSVRNAEFDSTSRTDTDINFGTTLSSQLYSDLTGFVTYRHARRFSDAVVDEFVENVVQAGVSLSF